MDKPKLLYLAFRLTNPFRVFSSHPCSGYNLEFGQWERRDKKKKFQKAKASTFYSDQTDLWTPKSQTGTQKTISYQFPITRMIEPTSRAKSTKSSSYVIRTIRLSWSFRVRTCFHCFIWTQIHLPHCIWSEPTTQKKTKRNWD